MKYPKIQEESLKNKVAQDFFGKFDCTEIIEKIDFTVKNKSGLGLYFLWAEAKADATDVCAMLTQLVLTIGKARMFDKIIPPSYLGCFDRKKIAFVPYHAIQAIFYQSDFNWKITPSNKNTREFKLVYDRVSEIIYTDSPSETYLFDFEKNEKELKHFISKNFIIGKSETTKVPIDKNNFVTIYIKWLEMVKPTIRIDWDMAKKGGIIDGDFYLADLLSIENKTLKEKLYVLLKTDYYELDRKIDASGLSNFKTTSFLDNQRAHAQFWAKYKRPPLEEYRDYIVERRDLLVPQDVRERKGAFFTPKQWVAKAHEYLAKTFGEDWQDEYYVWDNSAGTGNLLSGLLNKDNIWASTLDKADVDIMYDRIENGANLWKEQVFQFDFLNDDFVPVSRGGKLPDKLFEIINDQEKRKKLIFLINPPYGEAGNVRTRTRKGTVNEVENKAGVKESKMNERFKEILGGTALNEKYIQFFARIYADVPGCKMAAFVKPKYICGTYAKKFREFWQAEYLGGFATPARTHDNCTGNYPICLFIWDLAVKKDFPEKVPCDIFNKNEEYVGVKNFYSYKGKKYIIEWLRKYYDKNGEKIAHLRMLGTDMQNCQGVYIIGQLSANDIREQKYTIITKNNLVEMSIYFAVRKVIPADWLNDRDQFLAPNRKWKDDIEFQNDCLAYTLFHGQNKISSGEGTNHWIPFTEKEVGSEKRFESRFMSDVRAGKVNLAANDEVVLLDKRKKPPKSAPLKFSREASAVFAAGLELWRYYHSQSRVNANASFYDIREHFQGRNDKGKMNNTSNDETYNELIANLRSALKTLAKKIEPKVYDYGFLKK